MADTTKQVNIPEGSDDESIDLSAGFIAKNTPAAGEPASSELTPDVFMAQQPKPASVPDSFDSFMAQQEAAVALDGSEAGPMDGKTGQLDEALRTGLISRDDAHRLMQRSKHTSGRSATICY